MESISTLLEPAIEIARQAGERIREIYEEGQFQEITKSDNTPVTTADLAAHDLIVSALTQLAPEIPILSEEDADIPLADRQKLAQILAYRSPGWDPGVYRRQW